MATFFDDIKKVGLLPQGDLDNLISLINQSLKMRLTDENIATPFDAFVRDGKMEKSLVDTVVNVLTNIVDIIIRYDKDINDGFENIEKNIKNELEHDKDLTEAWKNVKTKITQMDYLILTRKKLLIKDSFLKIDTFSLICDVRPLFTLKRDKVVEFYYPILLSITDKKGIKSIFELDENDLKRVKLEMENALNKIEVLKKRIS